MGASETLRIRLLSSPQSFNKYIYIYDQKKFFLQNDNIFKKDLYFMVTQKFSVKKKISQMRYTFFTFSYTYFSVKKAFFSTKDFQYKTFFTYKNIFSANNVYFVKDNFFFKKKSFFST